jgi:ABC-type oligopeptide transport system substrate-binding subunit
MHEKRSSLLGPGILLVLASLLVLAACNSSSVSGTQSKPSNSTHAEAKSPKTSNGSGLQGLIGTAIANTR